MAILEVNNLRKKFDNTEILKGISFNMEKGQTLSIIGSSGSGKTTLLRCLNFLETPDAGTITVNGNLLFDGAVGHKKGEDLREKRLHFGMVFQQFNLFPQYSVLRNLTLPPELNASKEDINNAGGKAAYRKQLEEKGMELLTRIGLAEKKDNYPCELSGGQQQRVAIARALMLTPDILCFDEPTSALDPELTREVLQVIKDLKNSANTMIVVTHEMDFARNVSDRILFMSDGYIAESGAPDKLFNAPETAALKSFLNNSLN
jgi:polar amino acid transport system ATP-binding protein